MHPIYKFELKVGNTTRAAYPLYSGDLSKDYTLESGQQFFRAALSGDLTFLSDDYDFIVGQTFDTQFKVTIYVSYNAGANWSVCWTGQFWKTDCKFDADSETVVVKPTLLDAYTDVLNGWEKEYNLIELSPAIGQVKLDKRPLIQVYVPGQTVIGCFLAGMGWEQECEAVSNTTDLQNIYKFYPIKNQRIVEVSGNMSPSLPGVFMGAKPANETGTYYYDASGFRYQYTFSSGAYFISIIRKSDSVTLWQYSSGQQAGFPSYPREFTLSAVSGSGASGSVKVYVHDISVFARYLCDVDEVLGQSTYDLPAEDIVANNRNYHKVLGFNFPDSILFSGALSENPTPYGIYQPGQYYVPPASWYYGEVFPIARSAWGRVSLWFVFSPIDTVLEPYARSPFVLNDAYPLASVISVLLGQFASGVTHEQTTAYSQFLYGTNPISGISVVPAITPKSNLIYAGYDQPAQKAPITLKQIFDMLRDCFRCYWYIDSSNRLCIEHIKYFNNGMAYSGTPAVGVDLTTMQVPRNGKKWAYGKDAYSYDKPEMTARYQFGWMDEATQLFEGYPIDIVSNYVQKDKIENIDIQNFSSDVDYILLNPSAISKDGFVLMLCTDSSISTDVWNEILSQFIYGEAEAEAITSVFDLSSYRGQTVRVTIASLGLFDDLIGWCADSNGSPLQIIGNLQPATGLPNLFHVTQYNGYVNAQGNMVTSSSYNSCQLYDVRPGTLYRIKMQEVSSGSGTTFRVFRVEGMTLTQVYSKQQSGGTIDYTIPDDSNSYMIQVVMRKNADDGPAPEVYDMSEPSFDTWEFTVPANTVNLQLFSYQAYNYSISSIKYLVGSNTQIIFGLPYVNIQHNGNDHNLQNGYAAFAYLQRYYLYDMPALSYMIDGQTMTAYGIKKLKIQEVQFPQIDEPNLRQLIKTNLGNGKIRKMSLNLSSRNAKTTLEYDTE